MYSGCTETYCRWLVYQVPSSLHLFDCEPQMDRLVWCREYLSWTEDDWGRHLFSDESGFHLDSDLRRVLIWREYGSPCQLSNIVEKDHYG
ncbi:hypothetical protein TNCV_1085891 [Trichonephila clavipes]|nr:hypothetical protein TNCV_1085891 [Trichonephila clavipes]